MIRSTGQSFVKSGSWHSPIALFTPDRPAGRAYFVPVPGFTTSDEKTISHIAIPDKISNH